MNNNVKLAKELIKIAKELVNEENQNKIAKWNWKHPFTFDIRKQDLNELQDKIKNGQVTDVILVRFDKNDEHYWVQGKIIAPKDVKVSAQDLGLDGNNNKFKIFSDKWNTTSLKKVKEYKGCKVVWGTSNDQIEKFLNDAFNQNYREYNQKKIEEFKKNCNALKSSYNLYWRGWEFVIWEWRGEYFFSCLIKLQKNKIIVKKYIGRYANYIIKETEIIKTFSNEDIEQALKFAEELIKKNNNEKWQKKYNEKDYDAVLGIKQ